LNVFGSMTFLAQQIETQPGWFVGPIARVFGHITSLLFDLVYLLGPSHSLGLTIVLMTIIFRLCVMPLNIKAQKSMAKMRLIKPELDKIQAKYGNSKDPEIVKKMNAEKQVLMQKHDANPLKGCFPMLLQMPLFIGLNFIMRQAFLYISQLRNLYEDLARAIQQVPYFHNIIAPPGLNAAGHASLPPEHANAMRLIPSSLLENGAEFQALIDRGYSVDAARAQVGEFIDLAVPIDLARILHRFTPENWAWLQTQIPEYYWESIAQLNDLRMSIETFLGLSMVEAAGLTWPQIILPVLTVVTMFMSSWLMQQRQADPNADDKTKLQQKIMLFMMPLIIGFVTISLPGGVALFWITSQVFIFVQDFILMKKDGIPINLPFMKKE